MKKLEALVRPERLNAVRQALVETGHRSMISYDVWYRGTEREVHMHQSDGNSPLYDFMPKVRIELIVEDAMARSVVDTIIESARTGNIGDGKIFISPIEEAIRIQTKETGDIVL